MRAPFRRLAPSVDYAPTQTADNTFRFVFSNEKTGRDRFILLNRAIKHENYDRNNVVLFAHDDKQPPIGRGTNIDTRGPDCRIDITFVPREVLPFAGTIRDLVAGKWLRAVSLSWQPIEWKRSGDPDIDAVFTEVDMLEVSVVPLPALPDALLDARRHGIDTKPLYEWAERVLDTGGIMFVPREELESLRRSAKMSTAAVVARSDSAEWKVGAARDLPIEDSDSWDGPAAEKSIFEYAGGDTFSPEKARKGFLVYNAAKPEERGSYKLPIAHAVDGELKVPKGAIRAAASRISQTDIPDEVKTRAEAVLKAYEKKAGIGDEAKDDGEKEKRGLAMKHARAMKRAPAVPAFRRGLYDVAQLACMLEQLGYCHSCSEYEAALEGDESEVPGMLGEALVKFGEALIAMTDEEVKELLESVDSEDDGEAETRGLSASMRSYVARAKTPRARAWRAGIAVARAGKTLSASNKEKLEEAHGHGERALKHHRGLGEHQEAASGHLDAAQEHHERATSTLEEFGEHVRAAQENPGEASQHLERASRAHRAATDHMGSVAEAHGRIEEAHEDAADSHHALGRSVKRSQRCMRSVLDTSSPGTEESKDDPKDGTDTQRAARLERAKTLKLVS